MIKKSVSIKGKVDRIVEELSKNINENDPEYSRLLFINRKKIFLALNKLGRAGFISYFEGLDRKNIAAEKIQLLFLFIIGKYSENEFAEFLCSLYKDPNNNIPPYIEEIKPDKSAWKIINFLRALINRFKRKKFKIIDPAISKLYERDTRKKFRDVNAKDYSNFKENEGKLFSDILTLAIGKIFSIAVEANESNPSDEAFPPPPSPQELLAIEEPVSSSSVMSLSPPPPPLPLLLQPKKMTNQSNEIVLDKKVSKPSVVPVEGFTLNPGTIDDQRQKLRPVNSQRNLESNSSDEKSNNVMENLLKMVPAIFLESKLELQKVLDVRRLGVNREDSSDSVDWSEEEEDSEHLSSESKKESNSTSSGTDSGFGSGTSLARKQLTTEESNKGMEEVVVKSKASPGTASASYVGEPSKLNSVEGKRKLFDRDQSVGKTDAKVPKFRI